MAFLVIDAFITKTIDSILENSDYPFECWWDDMFPTDFVIMSKEDFNELSDEDFEKFCSDWIQFVKQEFFLKVCDELGINTKPHNQSSEQLLDVIMDKTTSLLHSRAMLHYMNQQRITM